MASGLFSWTIEQHISEHSLILVILKAHSAPISVVVVVSIIVITLAMPLAIVNSVLLAMRSWKANGHIGLFSSLTSSLREASRLSPMYNIINNNLYFKIILQEGALVEGALVEGALLVS